MTSNDTKRDRNGNPLIHMACGHQVSRSSYDRNYGFCQVCIKATLKAQQA